MLIYVVQKQKSQSDERAEWFWCGGAEDYHSNCSLPRSRVDAVAEIRTELKSWR